MSRACAITRASLQALFSVALFLANLVVNATADELLAHPVFLEPEVKPSADRQLLTILQHPVSRANFRQEKKIKGLSVPLISNGTFLYARKKGIH